uniref:Capsid protein n=1 Tax=Parvoviridae sp. TaxID=1940570 RepID=A0A7D3UW93_9VIRU|nr:MAG: capsid protein [Parvoviridae sp.]
MADKFVATNTWMCYIRNQPYIYPVDNSSTHAAKPINTGWHILPNMLWKHFVTPKQWAALQIHYEAYHVDSISIEVFNMIPMTQQLAIQGNTIFTAFNNCMYALGYTDKHYETNWHGWYTEDARIYTMLHEKEGLRTKAGFDTRQRLELPLYKWNPPNSRPRSNRSYENWDAASGWSSTYPAGANPADADPTKGYSGKPSGLIWDPFNEPDGLLELRPGKNAIRFQWNCHEIDQDKWFNFDQLAWWWPYTPEGPYCFNFQRPGAYNLTSECDPDRLASKYEQNKPINDYTIPNYCFNPIVPMQWWWKEMKESIAPYKMKGGEWLKRVDQFWVGTERECYHYGPTQNFMKLIPLFDSQGTHISATAQISIRTTLTLKVKKRRSAIFAPTWGPFSWYDLYTTQTVHKRFAPAMVRYRTGGMRRTWQNTGDSADGTFARPRETPYKWYDANLNPDAGGADGTFFNKRDETTQEPPRKRLIPTAPPLEEMDLTSPPTPDPLYPPLDQFRRK